MCARGEFMRSWETFLRITGWKSQYLSVDRFLRHYARKVKSEKTRENVCLVLKALSEFAGKNPDELVSLTQKGASEIVQNYVDSLAQKDYSIRYVNACLAYLKTFFVVNGFKGSKALDVERHYQPSRYRKRKEYIPTPAEIYKMAYAAGSNRNRALVLSLYTSGFRNSTIRALLYRDVKEELEKNLDLIKLPVYPEMKKVDPGACKGNIPYYSFISKEAADALREYLEERKLSYGSIGENEPLFASEGKNIPLQTRRHTLVMKKSLEQMIKRAAQKAGLKRWPDVYPHCLRKAFESALRNAGLDLKDQEFLMGHILQGAQDTYYDKTKTEYLRRKYSKVNFFPDRGYSTDEARKRQLMDMVQVLGFSDDKIKKIEEALAKYEHVDDAFDEIKKLGVNSNKKQEPADEQARKTRASIFKKREVKIVKGEKKLLQSLNHNWDLIRELPNRRFIITKENEFS
jgi:integrase